MQQEFKTERLMLTTLNDHESKFIFELLNTEGWKKFIGERHIKNLADADAYIDRICNNKNVTYWVVKIKENNSSIGIITLIKRDYLEHHDIGFAFLPEFGKRGYAYEAANMILDYLFSKGSHKKILATTIPANTNSIQLLEKLGLKFENEIIIENETLHVFGIDSILKK
jgi:RimJ/RimL family protein N-acetyltransferase